MLPSDGSLGFLPLTQPAISFMTVLASSSDPANTSSKLITSGFIFWSIFPARDALRRPPVSDFVCVLEVVVMCVPGALRADSCIVRIYVCIYVCVYVCKL